MVLSTETFQLINLFIYLFIKNAAHVHSCVETKIKLSPALRLLLIKRLYLTFNFAVQQEGSNMRQL
jgi:hypothetical protein